MSDGKEQTNYCDDCKAMTMRVVAGQSPVTYRCTKCGKEVTQPDCHGQYMKMDSPWADAEGMCSQTCPHRSTCYPATQERRKTEDAAVTEAQRKYASFVKRGENAQKALDAQKQAAIALQEAEKQLMDLIPHNVGDVVDYQGSPMEIWKISFQSYTKVEGKAEIAFLLLGYVDESPVPVFYTDTVTVEEPVDGQ